MLIRGEWYPCDDGVERPIIRGEARAADGEWIRVLFLVDSGADRTVFTAQKLFELGHDSDGERGLLGGVGGMAESVDIDTMIRLTHENDGKAHVPGTFAAFVDLEALDMSVLGRDVLDNFVLIIDRLGDRVLLINQRHGYQITIT
jgi:hypothetical protein